MYQYIKWIKHMSIQKKKSVKLPSDKKIIESKDNLSAYLNKVVNGEINISTDKETITSKLLLIKDIIEPMKQAIIDKKISYSILSKVLEKQINLKVSAQTLRTFCQNNLDFPKSNRKKKETNDINHEEDTFSSKKELSNNDEFD